MPFDVTLIAVTFYRNEPDLWYTTIRSTQVGK